MNGLDEKERLLRTLAEDTEHAWPGLTVSVDVKQQYLNMHDVLKDHPQLTEYAFEAARRAGVEPYRKPIRGGTDGSKLTFRGLPCPNIYTGGHEFHSKLEFNSRLGLEQTTETLVHLAAIFGGWRRPPRRSCTWRQSSASSRTETEMGRPTTSALYVVLMAAVIVAIDVLFFKGRFWERLAVNVGIVLVFTAFYFRFLKRP